MTMSGPGHDGPWSKMITYAPTIHALCGLTYLSNPPDRRDVGPGLLAQRPRRRDVARRSPCCRRSRPAAAPGEGQHIDIAQMETGTYLIGPAVLDYLTNGREAHPIGNADPFGQWCPNEVYRCGDQHEVAITCRDDDDWARLCDTVAWDIADLADDPELGTAAGRIARAAEIDDRLRRWCASRTADAAAAALQANGVPAGKVQDAGDLMADPQLRRPRLLAHDRPRRVRRAALRPLPGAVEHHRPASRTCCPAPTSASTTSRSTATSPA